jgi:polyhydroxybutyrate depolymerase
MRILRLLVVLALVSCAGAREDGGAGSLREDAGARVDADIRTDTPIVDAGGPDAPRPTVFGGNRPVEIVTPQPLTPGKRYPLILLLHGFGASGSLQATYFGTNELAEQDKAILLSPDGTLNSNAERFWNADHTCCDFQNQQPDDVAYLGGLIDDVMATWPIDPDAVFIVGHSNGGFMAYRLACERADVIAAIAPFAGLAAYTACQPARPVNVLHIHGTDDDRVPYTAGGSGQWNTGADASVTQWAARNGCGSTRTPGAPLDLVAFPLFNETTTVSVSGCPANGAVDFWTIEGGSHIPVWSSAFLPSLFTWLSAHQR